jgi:sugar lactone lactonase YvrE
VAPVTLVPRVMRYPTRLAVAPDGTLLVTDALAGAVFVLDAHRAPLMDLGGFGRPLGIAVDAEHIFVGDAASHQVRVFTRAGVPVRTVDDAMEMPNALALDGAGRLYVADSRSHVVLVYDGQGRRVNTLRQAGPDSVLNFPSSLAVGGAPGQPAELYVGDQGNARVVVFGLDGTFRRTLGQRAQAFGGARDGRFVRLQGLALDAAGNLHVADAYLAEVQVLDARTGAFLRRYQADNPQAMPLDLAVTPQGEMLFTDGVHHNVGVMSQATNSAGGQP